MHKVYMEYPTKGRRSRHGRAHACKQRFPGLMILQNRPLSLCFLYLLISSFLHEQINNNVVIAYTFLMKQVFLFLYLEATVSCAFVLFWSISQYKLRAESCAGFEGATRKNNNFNYFFVTSEASLNLKIVILWRRPDIKSFQVQRSRVSLVMPWVSHFSNFQTFQVFCLSYILHFLGLVFKM